MKYLKMGWNKKKGRGSKDLKKGGANCVKWWVPEKGGLNVQYLHSLKPSLQNLKHLMLSEKVLHSKILKKNIEIKIVSIRK